jgi:hypothetical protein
MKTNSPQRKGRTWCKYGNCSLEKLESELIVLNEIWTSLENNWAHPKDIEDVYRIYPLLDTTAAIARKMVTSFGSKSKKYKVEVVVPTNDKKVNAESYLYSDEHKFFNGKAKEVSLGNVTSTFLHGSEYVYMDTRKYISDSNDFKIYVFVKTDILCQSCAEANLKNPKLGKNNYRKTTEYVGYDDCICGEYINVRSYINSMLELVTDKIGEHNTSTAASKNNRSH